MEATLLRLRRRGKFSAVGPSSPLAGMLGKAGAKEMKRVNPHRSRSEQERALDEDGEICVEGSLIDMRAIPLFDIRLRQGTVAETPQNHFQIGKFDVASIWFIAPPDISASVLNHMPSLPQRQRNPFPCIQLHGKLLTSASIGGGVCRKIAAKHCLEHCHHQFPCLEVELRRFGRKYDKEAPLKDKKITIVQLETEKVESGQDLLDYCFQAFRTVCRYYIAQNRCSTALRRYQRRTFDGRSQPLWQPL
ncbi:hypothetical protein K438DRAFT_1769928 [Mycena galopus ATCC 62051]|nr:hypothetical protein K438DRAFT_1769928 [Mycena galopus ATCC 62051]